MKVIFKQRKPIMVRSSFYILLSALLSSCTLIPAEDLAPPPLLREPNRSTEQPQQESSAAQDAIERARFERAPSASADGSVPVLAKTILFPADEAADISLSMDGLPLPTFINEIFANQLKLSFEMAPDVANKQDLVTLRVTEPRNRQEIFELSRQVLSNYGVVISQQGDLLRFTLGKADGTSTEPPLIVTGAALPNVPPTHRPIFMVRDLNVIDSAQAQTLLATIFARQSIRIDRDPLRNAVTLNGTPELVKSAAEMLTLFDRPTMKGRHSLRVEPLYADVDTLARSLRSALEAQGYSVGTGSQGITLLPIKEINALFVLASSEQSLTLVRQWVEQLDRVAPQADRKDGFYWYQVRNAGADQLATTLNAVMNGSSNSTAGAQSTPALTRGASAAGASARAPTSARGAGNTGNTGSFVVDAARNMLLFRGEAEVWQELLPLIRELDQAPAQVLVEVIVADVTLTKSMSLGVNWSLTDARSDAAGPVDLKQWSATLGGNGLGWQSLNSSGSTRLVINALARDNKVSILQTPKILVRSGESATINVGQDVPIATTQSNREQQVGGTNQIIQSIEYRTTGVNLSVTPTVYSDGRIDMQIDQEVSSQVGDGSTESLTPIISTRNISTSLSLQDGSSVLLGGLITRTQGKGNSRVPILGSLPILGHLFRSDSTEADERELMILIVPYLVREPAHAERLSRAFREQLKLFPGADASLENNEE
jgi:general secretion pathway protein D